MKDNNMEDYRINGFYKGTKTDIAWSNGKQYHFRDGYAVDDYGQRSPFGKPLRYGNRFDEEWLNRHGLVPATDEMDIFDRVNEAAVNCTQNHIECGDAKCPYIHVPNCKDQMISDFRALREMRRNQKEHVHEAMPIQGEGGFVYDPRKINKGMIVGHLYRDKADLNVFIVCDALIRKNFKTRSIEGIRLELEGIGTKYKRLVNVANMDEFYEQFEPWNGNKDGGTFSFVALEDLSSVAVTRLFMKDHMYQVVDGRAVDCYGDMRFRNFDEAAAYFGSDKLILANGQGQLDDPTDGLYTGYAIYTGGYNPVDAWFTIGRVYRFVNGMVKRDAGDLKLFVPAMFAKYFRPIVNMKGV